MADSTGKEYGLQFTAFRRALSPTPPAVQSDWATRDVYFAHAAVTDVANSKFFADDKIRRPTLGMAGASTTTLNVWVDNWKMEPTATGWHIAAQSADFGYELSLDPNKPPTLHGDQGFSKKGSVEGQASYYYSMTRLQVSGQLRVKDRVTSVSGKAWFDHEFGSSQLGPEQEGWDWFSLVFDDNSELMLYHMRLRNGGIEPNSSGTFVKTDGSVVHLMREDFTIEKSREWKSPGSGATYPARWIIGIPSLNLTLEVNPKISDQELRPAKSGSVSYWEGCVRASGTRAGRNLSGDGYVELTGYAQAMGGRL